MPLKRGIWGINDAIVKAFNLAQKALSVMETDVIRSCDVSTDL